MICTGGRVFELCIHRHHFAIKLIHMLFELGSDLGGISTAMAVHSDALMSQYFTRHRSRFNMYGTSRAADHELRLKWNSKVSYTPFCPGVDNG